MQLGPITVDLVYWLIYLCWSALMLRSLSRGKCSLVSVVLRSIGSQICVFIKAIWNLHLWLRCIILNIFMRAIWTRQVLGRTCYVVLEHSMPSILCSRVQDSAEYRLKLVLITMAVWNAFHLLSREERGNFCAISIELRSWSISRWLSWVDVSSCSVYQRLAIVLHTSLWWNLLLLEWTLTTVECSLGVTSLWCFRVLFDFHLCWFVELCFCLRWVFVWGGGCIKYLCDQKWTGRWSSMYCICEMFICVEWRI